MKGKPTTDHDELIAQICESLKRHEQQLFDLQADVEGLKATLTGADDQRFGPRRENVIAERSHEIAMRLRSFDEAIAQLRGI